MVINEINMNLPYLCNHMIYCNKCTATDVATGVIKTIKQ